MAFLYLPPAQKFPSPDLARIVGLHLPNAMAAVIAALTAGVYAWRYLAKGRNPLDDARSKVAAALAAIFCLLTTVTGMVFAQYQWGAPWNWDPKQTSIFILLLIYAAYFVLRAGVDDPEKRASVAAVYMIFAAVMTPMLGYVIPKYLPSLHPTNATFTPEYHTVIWTMSACLVGVYAWLQNIAVRYERVRLLLEAEEEAR
jgi:heme exporter protein C